MPVSLENLIKDHRRDTKQAILREIRGKAYMAQEAHVLSAFLLRFNKRLPYLAPPRSKPHDHQDQGPPSPADG